MKTPLINHRSLIPLLVLLVLPITPAFAALLRKTFASGRRGGQLLLWLAVVLYVGGNLSTALAQGPLTPPGPPGPTMKALDQIASTGIAINATNTPGDTNYHFIIGAAGSYYLTGNLAVAKANGIHVTAPDVTIDLNGFQISRGSGTGGDGITVDGSYCTVKNGSISGFAYGAQGSFRGGSFRKLTVSGCGTFGLYAGDGWELESVNAHDNLGGGIYANNGCTLTNCTASRNSQIGIFVLSGCTVTNCTASYNLAGGIANVNGGSTLTNCTATHNVGSSGIQASDGSTLTNCTATSNTVDAGIFAGVGSTLIRCTANTNTSSKNFAAGISASDGCTLIACTASQTRNTNPTASDSTGIGIVVRTGSTGSTIKDCTVSFNKGDGIQAPSGCVLLNNTCTSNGAAAGSGIHATGSKNRIEGNAAIDNPTGFKVDSGGNLIIKNSNRGGSAAFDLASGNSVGEMINVYNGGAGATITSTNSWANFLY